MADLAIIAKDLGKQYHLGGRQESYATLRDRIAEAVRSPLSLFRRAGRNSEEQPPLWAVRGVSFEVREGEVVGVIGRNGAGKSTLLKILSRITEPTEGEARVRGRVGSLLEVGTGFHPELTGRENIYLSGAIQGMRRAEITRKFDEIVDFAEVARFIDTPVKRYSSGMYMRLAFSVAAHLEPDILLVDEVLAVGDASFQKKCLGKMEHVAHNGRTILFVSHNLASINALCGRGILLDKGRVLQDGPVAEVLQTYGSLGQTDVRLGERTDREGPGPLRFTALRLENESGTIVDQIATGQSVRVVLEYTVEGNQAVEQVDVAISVKGGLGELFFVCNAGTVGDTFARALPRGQFVCTIPRLPLPEAVYSLSLWAACRGEMCDRIDNAAKLTVSPGDFFGTGRLLAKKNRAVLVDHSWSQESGG
jgi:lipopolysaccharide transport system ATP-binding protein